MPAGLAAIMLGRVRYRVACKLRIGFLAEQPKRRAVQYAILKAKPEKPREQQPVAHLILNLLVRQFVQRLQNKHAEQHERVEQLPVGLALLRLLQGQKDRLDVAENLPQNQRRGRLQRIAANYSKSNSIDADSTLA